MACIIDAFAKRFWPPNGPLSMVPVCKEKRKKLWKMIMLKGDHKKHNPVKKFKGTFENNDAGKVGYVKGPVDDIQKAKIIEDLCKKLFKRIVFSGVGDTKDCKVWTRGKKCVSQVVVHVC